MSDEKKQKVGWRVTLFKRMLRRKYFKAREATLQKKYSKAKRIYNEILRMLHKLPIRNKAVFYFRIGEIYHELDLLPAAIEYYNLALEGDPNLMRARIYIAVVLARLGKQEEAESQLKQAFYLMNKNPFVVWQWAERLSQLGCPNYAHEWKMWASEKVFPEESS